MTTLALAIERQQWEVAALCLLLGVTRAAAALSPEAVEGLLDVLDPTSRQTGQGRRRPAPPREQRRGRPRTGRGRHR